jgi:Cation transporter/ATPase, N-terminus
LHISLQNGFPPLGTNIEKGLPAAEVAARIKQFGLNIITAKK